MSKSILITGASGNIGRKLRDHFSALNWQQKLLCLNKVSDPLVKTVDLSVYDDIWAQDFKSIDAVIHLAGDSSQFASWEAVQKNNIEVTENVVRAALNYRAKRLIFASSNFVMFGYRFTGEKLTTDLPPKPMNPYGVSKLLGERLGQLASQQGMSYIALRIGYCQPAPNLPGAHMSMGAWGQSMWLSDRDLCQAMERAVTCENVSFAILNLMSANPGMRWDITQTKVTIGYEPVDGAAPAITPKVIIGDGAARFFYKTAHRLERLYL